MRKTDHNPRNVVLDDVANEENYVEEDYLAANPDVAEAVSAGRLLSGLWHFRHYGRHEGRMLRRNSAIQPIRLQKMKKVKKILLRDMQHKRDKLKYDFLTEDSIRESGISPTNAISTNNYDGYVLELINAYPDGLILDCGAGKRPVYYENVVNFEVVNYDTTDVIGVGERLPFSDGSFDAVISIAVLEHVRDPFKCASEIVRVLRPGGKLICCVPFLQPEHGYPHHYYNMAPQGLRALFARSMEIDDHKVIESMLPIWSLTWIVQSWAAKLSGRSLKEFEALTVRELIEAHPLDLLDSLWVKMLPTKGNFELASATMLFAHKPD